MADSVEDLLRKKGIMGNMQIGSGQLPMQLTPTQNRPLVHQDDPKLLDEALQKAAAYTMTPGLMLGGAALGGPEAMVLKNLIPGLLEGTLGPFSHKNPEVQQDYIVPAYHGTYKAFNEFDPELTGDLGMHFGSTPKQAQKRIAAFWGADPEMMRQIGDIQGLGEEFGYNKGANIRPVNLEMENPVRLYDRFSVGYNRWDLVNDLLRSARRVEEHPLLYREPGLKFSVGNQQEMMDWASLNQGTEKDLWKMVERQIKESGHDAVVYENEYEGPGASFIMFDPKRVTPRFGRSPNYSPYGLRREPPMSSGRR